MARKLVTYFGGLIALYLIVDHGTASGSLITNGASGVSSIAKTLQGR